MKKIVISFVLVGLLYSQVIDKIEATVNDIPVTSYEIDKLSQNLNIKRDKALQILLDQKLLESEIKKRGIEVDDFEIENAMEKIAKQNGLSLFEFKNILMQKGEYKHLRDKIKNDLLKEKLFNQIVQTKLKITPEDIKNYYENHKNEFKVFKNIQVTKYGANNKKILDNVKKNPLSIKNIQTQTEIYSYNELPLGLLFLFKNTKVGEFTPIINEGLGYSMYYVARKNGSVYIPFEKVKNLVANKLAAQKREMILKDYFNKLKNRAYVKFYN